MTPSPCALSVAEHAGWAHLVCVGVIGDVPAVIERRQMTLIDDGLPRMPYHHQSLALREDEANALILRVRRSIAACAFSALQRVATDLSPAYSVVALAIREPTFPGLPDSVATVRQSYPLQCAADGMMYQLAICRAANELGLEVHQYPRGGGTAWAAMRLEMSPEKLESFVSTTGRPAGPPWTLEHRRAYAAGLGALAAHMRRRLEISIA